MVVETSGSGKVQLNNTTLYQMATFIRNWIFFILCSSINKHPQELIFVGL
jgi:hypothetical protein